MTFEKTPYYLASTVAAMEMHAWLPSLRVVALLRDPKARAYSSFYHHCDRNSRLVSIKRKGQSFEPFWWARAGGALISACGAQPLSRQVCADPLLLLSHTTGGRAPKVEDSKGRVVFNGDCARVEHCCCSPHDAKPSKATQKSWRRGESSGSGNAAAAGGSGVSGALSAVLGRHWSGARGGGDGQLYKLASCDAVSFDMYLSTTETDAESPKLGTILRKVRRACPPCQDHSRGRPSRALRCQGV